MQLQVARIGRPHGIRGEVTVQVLTDAPEDRFVPDTEFVVEPAALGPLTLRSARWNKEILLLAFHEVPDRNRAEELRGAKLFINTEETEDEGDAWYEHELVGLAVLVDGKEVGKVAGLNTMPAQDLLVVRTPEGEEVLVPFVTAIVPEVDVAGGFVRLTPPAGLFELNTPGAAGTPDDGDEVR
ncbi:ribosome maturation factor RimM [Arthrobacter sp. I2-34]|uniref:Ribosome maturation factor RimM n=1 Tax=Arthrobacter hankyongi TaxID=2904801 RepID=A0ABS9L763_9MICC|nr:ribosome maturation factor RimM [Arthrobacter hankyongi]MCG2622319.1 ribosome maturation factor RimM [Arthrobacter hankyongi]